jgi:hypothetical protein
VITPGPIPILLPANELSYKNINAKIEKIIILIIYPIAE